MRFKVEGLKNIFPLVFYEFNNKAKKRQAYVSFSKVEIIRQNQRKHTDTDYSSLPGRDEKSNCGKKKKNRTWTKEIILVT